MENSKNAEMSNEEEFMNNWGGDCPIRNEWISLADYQKRYFEHDAEAFIAWRIGDGKMRSDGSMPEPAVSYCDAIFWKTHQYYEKKYKKKNMTSYLYLTLSPDKFLRNLDNTEINRQELNKWATNWFQYNPRFYGKFAWCIECGSDGTHLHVHAVVELLNSHKHAEFLKKSWAKTFPNNQLLTSVNLQNRGKKRGEYAFLRFDKLNILQDKLDYFDNEKKGIHENMYDLNLRGSRGFGGV